MKRKLIFILIILISLSACSASSGGNSSASNSELLNLEPEAGALVQNEEQGLVAGINLNENIENEESITSNGDIGWIEGLEGKALLLDEDGEFISLPDSDVLDLLGGGSVSVWVYPVKHINFAGILHKGIETDFSDEAWSLQYWSAYKPSMILYNEAGVKMQITSDSSLELNTWHHLTASWGFDSSDGVDKFKFHVDGEKKGELAISSFLPLRNSPGELIIGSQLPESHSGTYGHITFRGAIDNILIYNRLLTEEEITDIYNEYSGL